MTASIDFAKSFCPALTEEETMLNAYPFDTGTYLSNDRCLFGKRHEKAFKQDLIIADIAEERTERFMALAPLPSLKPPPLVPPAEEFETPTSGRRKRILKNQNSFNSSADFGSPSCRQRLIEQQLPFGPSPRKSPRYLKTPTSVKSNNSSTQSFNTLIGCCADSPFLAKHQGYLLEQWNRQKQARCSNQKIMMSPAPRRGPNSPETYYFGSPMSPTFLGGRGRRTANARTKQNSFTLQPKNSLLLLSRKSPPTAAAHAISTLASPTSFTPRPSSAFIPPHCDEDEYYAPCAGNCDKWLSVSPYSEVHYCDQCAVAATFAPDNHRVRSSMTITQAPASAVNA